MRKSDEELIFEKYQQLDELFGYQSNIGNRIGAALGSKTAAGKSGLTKQANNLTAKLKQDAPHNNFDSADEAIQDKEWFKNWLSKNTGRDYSEANLDLTGNISQVIGRALGYANRYNLPQATPQSLAKYQPQQPAQVQAAPVTPQQPAPQQTQPTQQTQTPAPSAAPAPVAPQPQQQTPAAEEEPAEEAKPKNELSGKTVYDVLLSGKQEGMNDSVYGGLYQALNDAGYEIKPSKYADIIKSIKFENTEFIDCRVF